MTTWRQDVAREINKLWLAGKTLHEHDVLRILGQWVPLSIDEAEQELNALVDEVVNSTDMDSVSPRFGEAINILQNRRNLI